MKYVLYLLTVVCLLGARGCPSRRPPSARALLEVKSASASHPVSSTSPELKVEREVAFAKVIAHADSSQFRAQVAKAVNTPQETLGRVIVRRVADTDFLEVRAELPDPQLAAKVVNAVTDQLAQDFRENPDVVVRIVSHATPARSTR